MRQFLFAVILISILPVTSEAQIALAQVFAPQPYLPNSTIFPIPKSTINYTQIMFEHPAVEKAEYYQLKIFEMKGKDSALVFQVKDSSCATMLSGFQFASSYNWSYVAMNRKGKVIFKSPTYSFRTGFLPLANRLRVNVNDVNNNMGGLITFDYHTMIFDRGGNPVWFLPDDPKTEYSRFDKVRDLRVTNSGTITFITNRNAFEIMPDGRISWRAPTAGPNSLAPLHHGIERLPNGNLMTLGNHAVRMPVPFDTAIIAVDFGVIVEYDRKGKIVWKWDSYSYLRPAEIEFRKQENGQWMSSSHMNAFRQVSEGGVEYVYAGFRDLNRIIKIEKSSGKVVEVYGRRMNSGYGWINPGFFNAQHDVTVLSDGNIAVFNNDSISKEGVVSSLVIFSPAKPGQESRVVYRFACDFDKATNGKSEKCGSVDELPNKNLLVNFGTINRCIEITRDGKIVWDAFSEAFAADSNIWRPAGQYRSHYSSSLYPCYFTANIVENSNKAVTMNIWNEGTETDTYLIEYKSGDVWVKVASNEITPGKRTTCIIPKLKAVPFTQVRVISAANPDFIRVMDVK